MIRKFLTAATLALAALGTAQADPLAKDVFGHTPGPTGGAPAAIGFYSKGCVSGAVQLPESGPSWQTMRLSRGRNWGIRNWSAFWSACRKPPSRPAGRGFTSAT